MPCIANGVLLYASTTKTELALCLLVNKPFQAAGMSAVNVCGWKIARKMNIWPRSGFSRANVKCIRQIIVICSIKSPQCTDQYSKKFFDSDFPSPCFDVPKASNFTSGGVQNRGTKNRRLATIVTSFQDSKPAREKTDFPDSYLFSYKQRTIVSFLSELISSQ